MKEALYQSVIGILFLVAPYTYAQSPDSIYQKEIDMQVWKAFIESYNGFDAEKFNSIHTEDVLRAGLNSIRIGDEYKSANIRNFKANRESNSLRKIQLSFEHRVTTPDVSYEIGYYKVVSISNGEERVFYGQFHVVLKKIAGSWQIAQDWDANVINGKTISEEDFLIGTEIKF